MYNGRVIESKNGKLFQPILNLMRVHKNFQWRTKHIPAYFGIMITKSVKKILNIKHNYVHGQNMFRAEVSVWKYHFEQT